LHHDHFCFFCHCCHFIPCNGAAQTYHQIHRWQVLSAQTKLLSQQSFYPVAFYGQFFYSASNNQTQSGIAKIIRPDKDFDKLAVAGTLFLENCGKFPWIVQPVFTLKTNDAALPVKKPFPVSDVSVSGVAL
jgi:hypothetical protein